MLFRQRRDAEGIVFLIFSFQDLQICKNVIIQSNTNYFCIRYVVGLKEVNPFHIEFTLRFFIVQGFLTIDITEYCIIFAKVLRDLPEMNVLGLTPVLKQNPKRWCSLGLYLKRKESLTEMNSILKYNSGNYMSSPIYYQDIIKYLKYTPLELAVYEQLHRISNHLDIYPDCPMHKSVRQYLMVKLHLEKHALDYVLKSLRAKQAVQFQPIANVYSLMLRGVHPSDTTFSVEETVLING